MMRHTALKFLFLFALTSAAAFGAPPDESMIDCIRRADTKGLAAALKDGANPNLADPAGNTPLITAVMFGQTENVKVLLEAGAGLNTKNQSGNTALITACKNNRAEIVRLLLKKNPDTSIENQKGETCLTVALSKNFAESALPLIESETSITASPRLTAAAARCRNPAVLAALKEKLSGDAAEKAASELDKSLDTLKSPPNPANILALKLSVIGAAALAAVFAVSLGLAARKHKFSKAAFLRAALWTGAAAAVCAAVCALIYAGVNMSRNARINAAIAAAEKAGAPVSIARIKPQPIPDADNAVFELNTAFALMTSAKAQNDALSKTAFGGRWMAAAINKWPDAKKKEISDILYSDDFSKIFSALERAAQKSGYDAKLRYESGISMSLPHLTHMRQAARLLALKACFEAQNDRPDSAADCVCAGFGISGFLQGEPTLISHLVMLSGLTMMSNCAFSLANSGPLPEKEALRILDAMKRINVSESSKNAIAAEAVMVTVFFQSLINKDKTYERLLRQPGFQYNPLTIKGDCAAYRETMTEFYKLYELPPWERFAKAQSAAGEIPKDKSLISSMLPGIPSVFQKDAAAMTEMSLCSTTLELWTHKEKNGKFPDSLDALNDPAALDYTTGKQLTYKPGKKGFSLSAPGLDEYYKSPKK